MRMHIWRRRQNTWKGLMAGVIGGLVGSWTMGQFQNAVSGIAKQFENGNSNRQKQDSEGQEENDDATMKAANKISESLLGTPLTRKQKNLAGPAMHYAFGAAMGGAYGALVEHERRVGYGVGIPLGTVLFVGADEAAVPALGLSAAPTEYPLKVHAQSFAAHAVYGATTEMVRKYVRNLLDEI